MERKYIRTFTGDSVDNSKPKQDSQYLRDMMQGRKKYQRRQWVRDQEIYFGTKYLMNAVVGDHNRITFRCYDPGSTAVVPANYSLSITPFQDMYVSAMFGNGDQRQVRAKANETVVLNFSVSTTTDTQVTIYGANRIAALNDLSACYIAANNFSMATKLRRLVLGNTTPGYTNARLVSLTLGENKLLEELDIRNCSNLTGALNLAQCNNLLRLYAEGTRITGATFATNGKVRIVHLPSTINTLTMRNLNDLVDFQCSLDYLEQLTLQGGTLNNFTLISDTIDTLQTLYLYDIDWIAPDTTLLNAMLNLFYSQVTGAVYVSGLIRNQELVRYGNAWPNLTVTYDPNNLVQQHLITYVNADDEHTVLYQTYVDQGAAPPDPYALGLIEKPTLASTEQYTFDFGTTEDDEYVTGSGWDDIVTVVSAPRTITAVYTRTVRTYTVRWYGRAGLLLKELDNVTYGTEVEYGLDAPAYTDGEANNIYRLFKGWDKSTGFIKSDLDVYAIWDSVYALPSTALRMCDMTLPQIYGVCQANRAADYWETDSSDYVDITLGHDFDFSNVDSDEIGTDVLLTGINVDQYVSGGYYFNGAKAYTTNIKLFDEDSPAFTMALDFQFSGDNLTDSVLVSTYAGRQTQGEGFRIYSTNGIVRIEWGNSSAIIGRGKHRDIVVLRHPQGSRYLYVYSAGNTDSTFADEVTRSNLVRETTTQTSEPLTFGGIHFADGYRNYGLGHVHWCKIWYDDLGDKNAIKLATWPHEKVRMEYWGTNKYYQYGTARTTGASFICNRILGGIGGRNYVMDNDYYSHGWPSSEMRTFLGGRVFNAMPEEWQAIIKAVEINTKAEYSDSNVTTTSDKLYLYSYKEIVGSTSDFYAGEIGTTADPIPWLASANSRTKFKGKNRTYSLASIYQCSSEPSELYTTDIAPGSIWVNTSSSSLSYIFVPSGELTEYGITPDVAVDNDYAHGGWVTATSWWTRSIYSWSSESQLFVYVTPNGNYGYASPNQGDGAGVVFGFSI